MDNVLSGFVYIWVNKLNGKFYIGSHCGTPDDGYVTSGVAIRRAIKKYGIGNFERSILYEGIDFRQKETDLIEEYDAIKSNNSYNISHIHKNGASFGDSHKQKIRESRSNIQMSEETKNKISKSKLGNTCRLGKQHSTETKLKIGAKASNRTHSDDAKRKIAEAHKGKTKTAETRARMSAAVKLQHTCQTSGSETSNYRLTFRAVWDIINHCRPYSMV